MDFYLFSMVLGFGGLAFMALSGLHHSHGSSHGHGHGHDAGGHHDAGGGHHAGHGHHGGHDHAGAHGHHGHDAGHHHAHDAAHDGHDGGHAGEGDDGQGSWDLPRRAAGTALALLSPRFVSSVLVGMGATGLVARQWLGEPLLFAAALAGGAAFEVLVIRRIWDFFTGFASPAHTLEGAVMGPAQAVTGFDGNGQGLIAIELDGQITQLLGTLRTTDRTAGVRVRAGDRLFVEEVDAARNRCTVSLLGS